MLIIYIWNIVNQMKEHCLSWWNNEGTLLTKWIIISTQSFCKEYQQARERVNVEVTQ